MTKNEEWRDVVGYEGYYQVSDLGRVKRVGKGVGAVAGRILKYHRTRKGYLTVGLYDGNNHKTTKRIHRLVARAFIGPPPEDKPEVRHLDGHSDNNVVNNLMWGTNQDNKLDLIRHGHSLAPRQPLAGEKHPMSKLTEKQIQAIRDLLPHYSQTSIAKTFGVSQPLISAIKRGILWRQREKK